MSPMGYSPPAIVGKGRQYRFWIKSSRGTNQSRVIILPDTWKEAEIKAELEEWCSQFGAWHVGESYCTYGFEPITPQGRKRKEKR